MDMDGIEERIRSIRELDGVDSATLVSRSGMHITGDVPEGCHLETFVAMSAILVGAAETATNELRDSFGFIVVELGDGKLVLHSISTKALIVIKADPKFSLEDMGPDVVAKLDEIEDLL